MIPLGGGGGGGGGVFRRHTLNLVQGSAYIHQRPCRNAM